MIRIIIGAAAGAIAMFVIGFLFFATPIAKIGTAGLEDSQAAAVQQAMAANLPGTGTYTVPGVGTQAQTNMFSKGPIATVHYNIHGFAGADTGSLVGGLVLNFIVALLIGAGLIGIATRVPDFASRARLVVIFSIAASALINLGEPIFQHHDWRHFIFRFFAYSLMLSTAGLIIARWFLPRAAVARPETPAAPTSGV